MVDLLSSYLPISNSDSPVAEPMSPTTVPGGPSHPLHGPALHQLLETLPGLESRITLLHHLGVY